MSRKKLRKNATDQKYRLKILLGPYIVNASCLFLTNINNNNNNDNDKNEIDLKLNSAKGPHILSTAG